MCKPILNIGQSEQLCYRIHLICYHLSYKICRYNYFKSFALNLSFYNFGDVLDLDIESISFLVHGGICFLVDQLKQNIFRWKFWKLTIAEIFCVCLQQNYKP